MAKSPRKHYPSPVWAWKIDRVRLYAKLAALGGMEDRTKIRPDFEFHGNLMLDVGSSFFFNSHSVQPVERFEVRVLPSCATGNGEYHQRVSVRCPKCYTWTPFGRLHQHILSHRCLATAAIADQLPAIPSIRSAGQ